MNDAFDSPSEKPVEPIKIQPIKGWANKMERRFTKRWATFTHPEYGVVAAFCENAKYIGLTEVGNIPDFELTFTGRSTKTRNVMTVSLVENQATFHDSQKQAVEAAKEAK